MFAGVLSALFSFLFFNQHFTTMSSKALTITRILRSGASAATTAMRSSTTETAIHSMQPTLTQRFAWTATTASRGYHSTPPGRNKPPSSSSWGDLIPQPPRPSSSESSNPLSKILTRSSPQYKRFGQNSSAGGGGRGSGGRGIPIFYDRRYQVVGGVVTVGAGGYYVVHLET
ncbi:MAG: hypothetical protein J3R72DRAFT_95600 [Linnemannia gamsii]|nr:MAG: hypothetical protein J3R72DRAFT_95600 [Linnemannia gamsii]